MRPKTLIDCLANLPPGRSACLRGKHGIGKSQIVRQVADELRKRDKSLGDFPVIDRRLSQMSEGDIIGLPFARDGQSTVFLPVEWFFEGSKKPCLLFLDEINRAPLEIMQAAFQIVLDRELNGVKLHPQTRVITAINHTDEYHTTDMDPALLDRFWVADLEVNQEDWLAWARVSDILPEIRDFIGNNGKHLQITGKTEPGRVYPSPRSWAHLSDSIKHAGLLDRMSSDTFYCIAAGFVGVESAHAFVAFCESTTRITGRDIIERWSVVKKNVKKLSNEKLLALIESVVDHASKNAWDLTQHGDNFRGFLEAVPDELKIALYNAMTRSPIDKMRMKNCTIMQNCGGELIAEAQAKGIKATRQKV